MKEGERTCSKDEGWGAEKKINERHGGLEEEKDTARKRKRVEERENSGGRKEGKEEKIKKKVKEERQETGRGENGRGMKRKRWERMVNFGAETLHAARAPKMMKFVCLFITGSNLYSAKCRYLRYSGRL